MVFVKGHKGYWFGKKLSKKHRFNISKSGKGHYGRKKGCIPWNKGLKNCYQPEVLLSMSIAKKGKRLSKKHCKNIGLAHRGIKQTKEWRLKKRLAQLGENGSNWQGGKTKRSRLLRGSFLWKEWRDKVFKRDNYTCRDCGKTKCYLEPHHIKPIRYFPRLVYKVKNGITYCLECHIKNDKYRKQFTKKV